jgi:hypothetical protein
VLDDLGKELKRGSDSSINKGDRYIHLRLKGQHYELLQDEATSKAVFVAP